MAKPSEFYIGVIDLFAIMLPGAVAAVILEPSLSVYVFDRIISAPSGATANWAIFIAVSYFLGHIIFLIGSYLDPIYNLIRERKNPYGNESAFQCAKSIRDSIISESERTALNPFQWSRSVLLSVSPSAAQDVHRLEADSKFFRSLIVVSLITSIAFFVNSQIVEGIVVAVLVVPCFARYYERRLKSTTQAYIHVVTLERLGKLRKQNIS